MLGSLGGGLSTLWVTPRDHEFLVLLLSLTWWPAFHRHSIIRKIQKFTSTGQSCKFKAVLYGSVYNSKLKTD